MRKVKLMVPIISQTPITNDGCAVCGWAPGPEPAERPAPEPEPTVLTAWRWHQLTSVHGSVAMVVLCGIKLKNVAFIWYEYTAAWRRWEHAAR